MTHRGGVLFRGCIHSGYLHTVCTYGSEQEYIMYGYISNLYCILEIIQSPFPDSIYDVVYCIE